MTILQRAALLLLFLLGSAPARSATPPTPDASPPAATESLHALQPEPDSLRATSAQRADTALARAGGDAASLALRLFEALGVLALTYLLGRGLGHAAAALAGRYPRRRLFLKRWRLALHALLWVAAGSFVLYSTFALPGEALLVIAATASLVAGFAAQNLLRNFVGGLALAFDPPFDVGDRITVGATRGEVAAIGLCTTRITTSDDRLISVPNAQMIDEQVANAHAGTLHGPVAVDFYLPSWVDEAKARAIAYEATASSTYVSLQKPIDVHLRNVAMEGRLLTHLQVKACVLDVHHEAQLVTDVTERARHAFREQGLLPVHDERSRTALTPRPHAAENGPPTSTSFSSPPHSAGASE